jgi:hypothetical protein
MQSAMLAWLFRMANETMGQGLGLSWTYCAVIATQDATTALRLRGIANRLGNLL